MPICTYSSITFERVLLLVLVLGAVSKAIELKLRTIKLSLWRIVNLGSASTLSCCEDALLRVNPMLLILS